MPHDSSDNSDSEADSDLEDKSDDSEGSGHSKSDDSEGSGHSDLDNDLDTVSMDHMASSTSGQPSLHPDVSSGDFGKVVKLKAQRELSNREKFHHPFVPSKGYSFPARVFNHRQRHFQSSWLDNDTNFVYL